jgi:hypothetical protein
MVEPTRPPIKKNAVKIALAGIKQAQISDISLIFQKIFRSDPEKMKLGGLCIIQL